MRLSALAVAYKRRTSGDVAENLEQAIGCYREALDAPRALDAGTAKKLSASNDVIEGATRYNLGNALLRRVRGDRRKNLAEALILHRAVRVERKKARVHPQLLARSWLAIGNVHFESARLDTPPDVKSLRRAMRAYRSARRLLDADVVPSDGAMAAMLEGQAHALLPFSDGRRAAALECYRDAAELATRATDTALLEDIAGRRGSLLFRDRRFDAAGQAYADAFHYRQRLMAQATSGLTRHRQLAAMAPYGARLAYALIRTGRIDDGIDALHAARALDLTAALRGVEAVGDRPEAARYRAARAAVLALEYREQRLASPAADEGGEAAPGIQADASRSPAASDASASNSPDTWHALHRQLQAARAELDQASAALGASEDDAWGKGYTRLASQVGRATVLAVPIATDVGTLVVCATQDDPKAFPDNVFFLDDVALSDVRALLGIGVLHKGDAPQSGAASAAQESLSPGASSIEQQPEGWRHIVASVATAATPAERAAVATRMDRFFARLGRNGIVGALRQRLTETGAGSLRVVGLGGLQSLPLGMAIDPADGATLASRVAITSQIGLSPDAAWPGIGAARPRLLLVADPSGNLPFARWEAALIATVANDIAADARPEVVVLQGAEATVDALMARIAWADILHFAGHAAHEWAMPSRSSLVCADGPLSVQDLSLATLYAPLELVVLSACDSGLTDVTQLPEEFVGLPAAFLALGAKAVVSSAWSLPDEATALLMAEFYRLLLVERLACADALASAQRRMVAGTAMELGVADRLDALYQAGGRSDAALARRALAHRRRPDERAFSHPLYWGAHGCQVR